MDQASRNLHEKLQKSGQLAYYQCTLECDHTKGNCQKFWNGSSSDGRFFIIRDPTLETNNAMNYIWKDAFSNKACLIKIPVVSTAESRFWPLTDDTGVLLEYIDNDSRFGKFSLSLMELDWVKKEMCKANTLTFENQQRRLKHHAITTEAMDPTRFLMKNLSGDYSVILKFGRICNNEILLGEEILPITQDIRLESSSLVGNTLYGFSPSNIARLNQGYIDVTCLDQNAKTSRVTLDSISEQFSVVKEERFVVGCFAMERFYLAVQHKMTEHYEIIWVDTKTRKWTLTDFCTKEPITDIQFMASGHFLWIQTTDKETEIISGVHRMQKTFYRIPLKKPEKLSDLAWFNLVRSKSRLPNVDPHEEAQKYLPYYSEIRCPFDE